MSTEALASKFPSSPAVRLEDQPGTLAPFAMTKGIAWTIAGCAALFFIPLAGVPPMVVLLVARLQVILPQRRLGRSEAQQPRQGRLPPLWDRGPHVSS